MAVACSTSAFKVSLNQALQHISRLGFQYVDLICITSFGHIRPDQLVRDFDNQVRRIEADLAETGLSAAAVNCAFPSLYERDDEAQNRERIKQVEAVARLMRHLGVSTGSFFPGGNWPAQEMPWEKVLANEAATIREILDVAARHEVTLGIELHANTPFERTEQAGCLLDAVPELKVVYDPSHFTMQSIPLQDTEPFLPRVVHVHLRDAAAGKMQAPLGSGTVDFEWVIETLRRAGYTGNYSLEYLPNLEGDVDAELLGLRRLIEKLQEIRA